MTDDAPMTVSGQLIITADAGEAASAIFSRQSDDESITLQGAWFADDHGRCLDV